MPTIRTGGILVAGLLAIADLAYALPCDVVSTNDGNGLFTYIFQRGDTPFVWGLQTNDSINLQAYGILEVHNPPGWTHSIFAPGWISWTPTVGTNFLDEPVTFSLRSCLTEPAHYERTADNYPAGIINGAIFALPERTNILGGGYQSFNYVGPALPHLTIEQSGADIILRWPASASGLRVETSDLNVLAGWIPISEDAIISGSTWTLKVNSEPSARFFRLVTPCSS